MMKTSYLTFREGRRKNLGNPLKDKSSTIGMRYKGIDRKWTKGIMEGGPRRRKRKIGREPDYQQKSPNGYGSR